MTYQVRGKLDCVLCKTRPAIGRKLCKSCYYKMRRRGHLNDFSLLQPTDVFENRIKKTATCWLWKGTKNGYGYGIFLMPGEKPVRAHRYSYEFFKGKIPPGKIIMHTCDNPPCVNPAHLQVGTKADNNADTSHKRRHHYGTDAWNGKLSDRQVRAIRASKENGNVLAKKYGVSQPYISRIRRGEKRRYVK